MPLTATAGSKLRLLVGKVGLDGHDRGAKIIARALRDAGFEVIYTGLHQTPEMVVATAIQEDVDAVSLSILSGAHNTLFPRVIDLLKRAGVSIPVFGGGIIPEDDVSFLRKAGVKAVFTPGTSTQDVIDWVRKNIRPRGAAGVAPKSPPGRPASPSKRSPVRPGGKRRR
ncbi:MAG: methylmalonyl-CoA mutase [Acidobacteria bacterium]|nr:MAG: methylmalonyl-CoA mutase [Acidobacteriota bacterium]